MKRMKQKKLWDRLNPREKQIVELLLRGWENEHIATELKCAKRTIKAHFNRMFMKFGINDERYIKRVVLAVMFYRAQLATEDKLTEPLETHETYESNAALETKVVYESSNPLETRSSYELEKPFETNVAYASTHQL